jgi:hypothetical protein
MLIAGGTCSASNLVLSLCAHTIRYANSHWNIHRLRDLSHFGSPALSQTDVDMRCNISACWLSTSNMPRHEPCVAGRVAQQTFGAAAGNVAVTLETIL